MSKWWIFAAMDTWFFRDGTPFHSGEMGSTVFHSEFPPSIHTLQGAIRTTLAKMQGWRPDRKLPKILGDGENLGCLRLTGPFLRYKGKILFPLPRVIIGKKTSGEENWTFKRLTIGGEVECDLGKVRLPLLDRKDGNLISAWTTKEGLERVLRGGLPKREQIYFPSELWKEEWKIGISINPKTRSAEDRHLYQYIQIRPFPSLEIMVKVEGVPDDWHPKEKMGVCLGGEGKLDRLEVEEIADKDVFPSVPPLGNQNGKVRFVASLLTPGQYSELLTWDPYKELSHVVRNGPLADFATCVSASIDKLVPIGGWNIEKKEPRPKIPHFPAGSTWFYEAPYDQLKAITAMHGTCAMPDYGKGYLVIGTWEA